MSISGLNPQALGTTLCDERLLVRSTFLGISHFLVNFPVLEMLTHNLILTVSQLALSNQ